MSHVFLNGHNSLVIVNLVFAKTTILTGVLFPFKAEVTQSCNYSGRVFSFHCNYRAIFNKTVCIKPCYNITLFCFLVLSGFQSSVESNNSSLSWFCIAALCNWLTIGHMHFRLHAFASNLIGSLCCLHLLRLAGVITLVLL